MKTRVLFVLFSLLLPCIAATSCKRPTTPPKRGGCSGETPGDPAAAPEPIVLAPAELMKEYHVGDRFEHYTSHVVQGRGRSKTWFGIDADMNIFLDNASVLKTRVTEATAERVTVHVSIPRIEQQLVVSTRRLRVDPDLTPFGQQVWQFAADRLPPTVKWTGELVDTLDPGGKRLLTYFCGKLWEQHYRKQNPYVKFAGQVDKRYQGVVLRIDYMKGKGVTSIHQAAGPPIDDDVVQTLGRRLGSAAFLDYTIQQIIASKLKQPGDKTEVDVTELLGVLGLPWDIEAKGSVTLERLEDEDATSTNTNDVKRIVLAVKGGNVQLTVETEEGPRTGLIQPKEGKVYVSERGMVETGYIDWEAKSQLVPRESLLIRVGEFHSGSFKSFVARREMDVQPAPR